MYAYLKGKLTSKTPTSVTLEAGGVGYLVEISLNTYSKIEALNEAVLWVQLIVREDSQTLYGFFDKAEKAIFNLLISVSGIGPNTARLILSGMTPSDVSSAILSEDELAFKRVKGVGPKTAKRLIVELKDKLDKADAADTAFIPATKSNSSRQEALSALIALGFQAGQVQKVLGRITGNIQDDADTEDWIKAALKELSK